MNEMNEINEVNDEDKSMEKLAVETVKRREPNSTEFLVTGRVRDFMDGQLLIVNRKDETESNVEDLVFVRRGHVSVYDTAEEMATSLKSIERSAGLSRFLEGRAISGLLAIVLASIWIFFVLKDGNDVPPVVEYSFGLVVGYYFKGEVQKRS